MSVTSKDDADISAKSGVKAISSTTNDGGASIHGGLVDAAAKEYNFTSKSGSQEVEDLALVRVAADHTAGGVTGAIYIFRGAAITIDLGAENYSNEARWTRFFGENASSIIPNIGNITDSDSLGVGGLVVRNDVRGNVQSFINNATVDVAGDLTLSADESATLIANDESLVSSSGGSAFGEGQSLAVNALISTNIVQSQSSATITNSDITTTNSGDLTVDAKNTSGIDATVLSSTQSGDTAVGVTLAFNTLGWEAQNILFAAIDALLGTDIGNENPAKTVASIVDTPLTIAGDLKLAADNTAILNATVSNAAVSEASALFDAGGTAAGAVLTSNMVSSAAQAFIDFTGDRGNVRVTGEQTILAKDDAGIFANTKLVSSSTTTNDGGAALANETISNAFPVDFLSADGSQEIELGEFVRLADDYANGGNAGSVYEFMGTTQTVDLSAEDYSNQDFWKENLLTKVLPQGLNVTESDSMAVGAMFVRNDVRSFVDSFIDNATVTTGALTLNADETATIKADIDSTAESSGGSAIGEGQSLALSGVIATNLVLSRADAFITNSSITTTNTGTTGNALLNAINTSAIEATIQARITSGDEAFGATGAFNTLGWAAQDIITRGLDAVLGTDIGTEQPARVQAYTLDTSLDIAGDLALNADSAAVLIALAGNDATSAASALVNASGVAMSGLLSSNMVSSFAKAYIDFTGDSQGLVDVGGNLSISSKDDAIIDADSNMRAISSTTNDGGASLVGGLFESITSEFTYSSKSGTVNLTKEISTGPASELVTIPTVIVRVASDHDAGGVRGAFYGFIGEEGSADLGAENYLDTTRWQRLTQFDIADVLGDIGNVTGSDSLGVGGLVVRNDVRSDVQSFIDNAQVTVDGGLTLTSDESAIIEAQDESVVSSSGGSNLGEGTSAAIGGTLVTNLVQSQSIATITNSDVTTTSDGNATLDAKNTSAIDATVKSSISTGDEALTFVAAFNTLGYEAQNIIFAGIDAILGTDIGTENPAESKASIENTNITVAGNLKLNADNLAQLNATISNAAISEASALHGATGMAAGGLLASNMVSSRARAFIDKTGTRATVAVDGTLDITSKDDAGIFSNVKIVNSSTTTNDGGAAIGQKASRNAIPVEFLSGDGEQPIKFGQKVRLAEDYDDSLGNPGSIYEFMGSEKTIDLANEDYTNLDFWKEEPLANLIPQGFNISDSDSMALGGMIVRNDARSNVEAFINNAIVTAGALSVIALETATIKANNDSTATSSGGSSYGSGTSLAVNGVIATNALLSRAVAYVINSSVTTTSTDTTGNAVLDAKNTSSIDATTKASIESGDTAFGITLAFNTLGWKPQNLLFATLDVLLGTLIGSEQPAEVQAYVLDTALDIAGDLTINADSSSQMNAAAGNDSTSAASAIVDASGMSISGLLASNMVNSFAKAFVEFTGAQGTVDVGGEMKVTAATGALIVLSKDKAGIFANTKVVSSSITTNDGGLSVGQKSARALESGVLPPDFLTEDGEQEIQFGDRVKLAVDYGNGGNGGSIYKYMGETDTLDLGSQDYDDIGFWQNETLTDLAPTGLNVDDSDSMAIGGLLVRNDVRATADSLIDNATVTAASVTVNVIEDATIRATADVTAESSGGSAQGEGQSLAVNATIATNLVLSRARAIISNSTVKTTSGDGVVDGKNTSFIRAKTLASTTSGDTGGTGTMAFNTVGFKAQNILFQALDALLSDTLIGAEQPIEVTAKILDTPLDAAGDILVRAVSEAFIKATLSNETESIAYALEGASSMAVGAVLGMNLMSSFADAIIDSTGGNREMNAGGKITVYAQDDASIRANSKLSAISSTTNDQGISRVTKGVHDALGIQFTDRSGVKDLIFGNTVQLDDVDYTTNDEPDEIVKGNRVKLAFSVEGGVEGDVFEYIANTALEGPVNLEEQDYSDTSKWRKVLGEAGSAYKFIGITEGLTAEDVNLADEDYTNALRWIALENLDPTAVLGQFGVSLSLSESDSAAFGGLVIRNDVRSSVRAFINRGTINAAGDLTVQAIESAILQAQDISVVTSSGGSLYGEGSSTAVGAVIATNAVRSKAEAYVTNSSIKTTNSGNVLIEALNTSKIDATVDSTVQSGGEAVGVVAAFNTIGIGNQNILFSLIDAITGVGLTTEVPASTFAYTDNTTIDAAGSITTNAQSTVTLIARILNSATALSLSAEGDNRTIAIAPVVALNKTTASAQAYIDDASVAKAGSGDITVTSTDASLIEAEVRASSLAISGGTGKSTSISVGIAASRNEIHNEVLAFIRNSGTAATPVETVNGNIIVKAEKSGVILSEATATAVAVAVGTGQNASPAVSGAGTLSFNKIRGKGNAFIEGSVVNARGTDKGDVDVTSINTSVVDAFIASVAVSVAVSGKTAPAVAIGIAVARNIIGWKSRDEKFDFNSDQNPTTLATGDRVKIVDGPLSGDVYEFVGSDQADSDGISLEIQNYGDRSLWKQVNLEAEADEVMAYLGDTSVDASGDLTLDANGSESISATVVAGAVAIGASKKTSIAVGVAGVYAENRIQTDVKAFIDGDGATGIKATSFTATASDSSTIAVIAGAASVAAALGGKAGVAVSIGAAIALNEISNNVNAFVKNADSTVDVTGNVLVKVTESASISAISAAASLAAGIGGTAGVAVSGAGAIAQNIILTATNAFIDSSVVKAGGNVDIETTNTSSIQALNVSASLSAGVGGTSGVGVSIGIALAFNYIGHRINDAAGFTFTTDDDPASISKGQLVKIATACAGNIYEYIGPITLNTPNLRAQDYSDQELWRLANLVTAATPVTAYARNSSIDAAGSLKATADSTQKIDAIVLAGSVALSGGGTAGVGVSGAGSAVENRITVSVKAYIDGDGATGIDADSITIDAKDSSSIDAIVGAASVAVALGGTAGVAVAIGVALAFNEINNDVDAYIINADQLSSDGDVTITATSIGRELFNLTGVTAAQLDDASSQDQDDEDTGADEKAIDEAGDTGILNSVKSIFSQNGTTLQGAIRISKLAEGESWIVVDESGSTYFIRKSGSVLKVSESSINAISVAASVGVGVGGTAGIAVSGAGAVAINNILNDTNATIENSNVTAGDDVALSASSTANISAIVGAVAVSVGAGGAAGVGVAIGISFARNFIGFDSDGNDGSAGVRAQIINSSINAQGDLTQSAAAAQMISALVLAGSAAVGAGGAAGVGTAGSGVLADNRISIDVNATIDGDGANGIRADTVTQTATDLSIISAFAGAVAIAASFGGAAGVSLSIGVSLGHNTIDNSVEAGIKNADQVTTTIGDVTVLASEAAFIHATSAAAAIAAGFGGAVGVGVAGAGAEATNVILTNGVATIENSVVDAAGNVNIDSTNTAVIKALNISASVSAAAGGAAGVGVSIGVAIATNLIGFKQNPEASSTFTTDDNPASVSEGQTVKIANGARKGNVYEYIGNVTLEQAKTTLQFGLTEVRDVETNRVYRYVGTNGDFTLSLEDLTNTSRWSFIGEVEAFLVEEVIDGETVTRVKLRFKIGKAAWNLADANKFNNKNGSFLNTQDYANQDLWKLVNLTEDPAGTIASIKNSSIDADGALTVTADSTSIIDAFVFAGSVAIGGGGAAGVGLSGSGSSVENRIKMDVKAFIDGDGATGIQASRISVTATDASSIRAFVGAASVAASVGGAAGVSFAIGIAMAFNEISNNVAAFIDNADNVTSESGDVIVTASSKGDSLFDLTNVTDDELDDASKTDDGDDRDTDIDGDQAILDRIRSAFADNGETLSENIRISQALEGEQWVLVTEDGTTYYLREGAGGFRVFRTSISATSVAASVALAVGGLAGVSISGAGAYSKNVILTNTDASIQNSSVTSAGDVTITGTSTSEIAAVVGAVSIAAAGGGAAGVGVAIGISIARNFIGFDESGNATTAGVRAFVKDSSIQATGDLTQTALASQTIGAFVLAGAGAIAGGLVGVAASGSGVVSENRIGAQVQAYIDGDGASGISAESVSLSAQDLSLISANALAISLAAGFGAVGVSISVGVSLAQNSITTIVEAYIKNADTGVTSNTGNIELDADESAIIRVIAAAASVALSGGLVGVALSGAGAEAKNLILSSTKAFVEASVLTSAFDVIITADNTAIIDAIIATASIAASAGAVGVGASIGVSLARNQIGFSENASTSFDFTTASEPSSVSSGQRVKILEGVRAGDVYEYLGTSTLSNPDLQSQDYSNKNLWKQVNLVSSGSPVMAYVNYSSVTSGQDLRVEATANQTINSKVLSGAVAVAAGLVGGAVSGTGVSTENTIRALVHAYIEGTLGGGIQVSGDVIVKAEDTSVIDAETLAASIAAFFGVAGGAVSIGLALAFNTISSDVQAYITGATINGSSDMTVQATETATIDATAAASAFSASVSLGGLSIAGGGAVTTVNVLTSTKAFVETSTITLTGDLDVTATSTTTGTAKVDTAAESFGLIASATAGSVALGVVSPTVEAFIDDSTITVDDISVTANGNPSADMTTAALSVSIGLSASIGLSTATATGTALVTAGLKDGSTISGRSLSILSKNDGTYQARSSATSCGILLGAAGAITTVSPNLTNLAILGDNNQVTVDTFQIRADQEQDFDGFGGTKALGLAATTGANVNTSLLSKSNVDIGRDSTIIANTVLINAFNDAEKRIFGTTLDSGYAGGVAINAIRSGSTIGTDANPAQAVINIGSGTEFLSQNQLTIEALTIVNAEDKVSVEGIAGLGISLTVSDVEVDTLAAVNVTGAKLEVLRGNLVVTARTDSEAFAVANVTAASGIGGSGANSKGDINTRQELLIEDTEIYSGENVKFFAGKDSNGVPNLLDGLSQTNLTSAGFFTLSGITTEMSITEKNQIDLKGTTDIKALEDVEIITRKGISTGERKGFLLNISLLPYGEDIDEEVTTDTTNSVNIDSTARIETGVNNISEVLILSRELGVGADVFRQFGQL